MSWLAGAFCAVAVLAPAGYAAARGWRLWRTAHRVSERASDALAQVTEAAAQAEERARTLTGKTERLDRAIAHLQGALAELAVLRAALSESTRAYRSLRGLVPGK
jgi:ABC-type transporter Mla subunit MlaD